VLVAALESEEVNVELEPDFEHPHSVAKIPKTSHRRIARFRMIFLLGCQAER
jgi:hypothetical protein